MMNLISSSTAFLGPIGGPELIIILIVVFLVGLPIGIVLLVVALSKPKGLQVTHAPPVLPQGGVQTRLQELEALRAQGLISEEEYAEKRKDILGQI